MAIPAARFDALRTAIQRQIDRVSALAPEVERALLAAHGRDWARLLADRDRNAGRSTSGLHDPRYLLRLDAGVRPNWSEGGGSLPNRPYGGMAIQQGTAVRAEWERAVVSTLGVGDTVDDMFACSFKERRVARGGTPYLSLRLRDRSGAIAGRVFFGADDAARCFDVDDVVRVVGKVQSFQGVPFVSVRRVWRIDPSTVDASEFLPVAWRDVDELDGFLDHLAGEVSARDYRALLASFLDDRELRAKLRRAACTAAGHHAYLGGLLEHTVAVTALALEACTLHATLDSDLLLTAAVLHDIGKIREFSYGTTISLSQEGSLVGHLALGRQLVAERAKDLGPIRLLALEHCIQGHHGPHALPTGRFELAEAVALYRLNAVDAEIRGAADLAGRRLGGVRRVGLPASEAQRAKVRRRDCLICGRRPVDPAHVVPRKHGGCDHPDCVVALCRPCHRAYDKHGFDLWPWLRRTRRFHRELAHARAHVGLRALRQGVSGRGW